MAKVQTKTQKLLPAEIDVKVLEILRLDQQAKTIGKQIAALKKELEDQYTQADQIPEIIQGLTTEIVKMPVNNGRNSYDPNLLRPFLQAIRKVKFVIKTVEVVDTDALEMLVKDGKLAPEILNSCRKDKWTFKSAFRRIEQAVQEVTGKKSKAV